MRVAHRVFRVHRYEPCTLILAGFKFRGRCCRCGHVDENSWLWAGTAP